MSAPPANRECNVAVRSPRRRTWFRGVEVVGRNTPSTSRHPPPTPRTPTTVVPAEAGTQGTGAATPYRRPHATLRQPNLSFRAKPRNLNRCSAFAAPFTNTPYPHHRRAGGGRYPGDGRGYHHNPHPQPTPVANPHRNPPPSTVLPHPGSVPTPQPSYRTPMRYPWWGPGGAHPRTTLAVIPSAFFCHSERSRRTSRPHYVHPRTTPTHYRQATHHHHLVIPDPQPSYRTPMRFPWWGPGGAHAGTTHTSLPPPPSCRRRPVPRRRARLPPQSSPPTNPRRQPPPETSSLNRLSGPRFGTHAPTVLPHPDAVSMVGPGRRTPSHHPCRHTERFFLSF